MNRLVGRFFLSNKVKKWYTIYTSPFHQVKDMVKKKTAPKTEEFKVKGVQLLKKVKQLIKEGNVRRIVIKDKNGKVVVEFPVTIGVIGVALAPALAAVGAIAALLTESTITVKRR